MQITRNGLETTVGPGDWFAGASTSTSSARRRRPPRVMGGIVHFTPGARTAWHTHPAGQTIFVTEGIRPLPARGGTGREVRPGDRVYFEPGENHWHGATPTRFNTQIAYQESDDSGQPHHVGASPHWGGVSRLGPRATRLGGRRGMNTHSTPAARSRPGR